LAGTCEQEDRIVDHLRKRFGHVSAERAISGSGLENIYQAIAALEGLDIPPRNATEITRNALRVVSVNLPDDRCTHSALFWDRLRGM
jgi:glucokinase